MNPPHQSRALILLLFILVAITFFGGTLRTFTRAYAATVLENPTSKADLPSGDNISPTSTSIAVFPSPGSTPTPPPTFTPTAAPTSELEYGDTTGIIYMAILLVVVILVGMASGRRSPRMK